MACMTLKKQAILPPLPQLIRGNKMRTAAEAKVNLTRSIYDQETLGIHYKLASKSKMSISKKLSFKFRHACSTRCDRRKAMAVVRKYLPFIGIMRHYKWRKWLTGDLISGISCGTVHIPQSLGYSTLIGLPAVYGLYSSFFPLIIYFFFGTSHHLSIGTVAVVSLIVSSAITKQLPNLRYIATEIVNSTVELGSRIGSPSAPVCGGSGITQSFTTTSDASLNAMDSMYTSNSSVTQYTTLYLSQPSSNVIDPKLQQEAIIMMVLVMTFVVGMMQLIMGLCHLGVIASFMSTPFNTAYQTAAAFHTAISQLAGCLGYTIGSYPGVFTLIYQLKDLFTHLYKTNAADIITALITLVVLVFLKEFINVKYAGKLPVPIPADLLIVVVGTLISYLVGLNSKYCVKIIGNIPRGFPKPEVPVLLTQVDKDYYYLPSLVVHLNSSFILDCFAIAIVSYVMCMTMAKIFARKYRYTLDDDQELVAYGLMNIISSFFHCYPVAQSPPRTMIFETTGGMTQISGLISAVVVLIVIVGLGPLFFNLPKALLAMVIIVALFPLFKQFKELKVYWKINKFDFFVWVVTFLAVLLLDLPTGLAVGIGWNLLIMCAQSLIVKGYNLSSTDYSDLFVASESYVNTKNFDGIQIFRYEADIFFANVANFKRQLFACTVNPQRLQLLKEKLSSTATQLKRHQSDELVVKNDANCAKTSSVNLGFASTESITVTLSDENEIGTKLSRLNNKNKKKQGIVKLTSNKDALKCNNDENERQNSEDEDKICDKLPVSIMKPPQVVPQGQQLSTESLNNRRSSIEMKHVTICEVPEDQELSSIDGEYLRLRRRSDTRRLSIPEVRATPAAAFDAFYHPSDLDNISIDEDDADLNEAVADIRSHIGQPKVLEHRASAQMLHTHTIILDCSAVGYIDFNGLLTIRQLFEDYRDADIMFLLAGCGKFMLAKLKTSGIYDEWSHHIFPSIIDAVLATQIHYAMEKIK